MDNRQLLELFQSRGLIDTALGEEIFDEVENSGKSVPELLADFGVIQNRDDVWPIVATELGANTIDLKNWIPPQALLDLVPAGTARLHGALPVNFDNQGLHVVLVDPLNPQTVEDLRFTLGREIIVVVAPDYLVEAKINECYGGEGRAMNDILSQLDIVTEEIDAANASIKPSKKRPPIFISSPSKKTSKSATEWMERCMKWHRLLCTLPYPSSRGSRSWPT
jgi:type IV pilus assembly protein PilB